MKIVINVCHGGFGISEEAFLLLREMKNKHALAEPYYGELFEDGSGPRKNYFGVDSFGKDIPRNDPDLISVIEKLQDKANGRCANLEILEIPDDVKWQIEEYDGLEHVAEKHRTWR